VTCGQPPAAASAAASASASAAAAAAAAAAASAASAASAAAAAAAASAASASAAAAAASAARLDAEWAKVLLDINSETDPHICQVSRCLGWGGVSVKMKEQVAAPVQSQE
jgi:hypothetical protein